MTARGLLRWFRMGVYVVVYAGGVGSMRAETPWTGALTQLALTSGYQAKLPPHLAMVLGLAPQGESIEVRQLVSRADQKVRTFNVSVAHHQDLVVFLVDERKQATVAYLLTPAGKLRKAVAYHTRGEPRELSASEAHAGLAREVRYWSEHGAESVPQRANPPKPAEPSPTR